MVTFFTTEHFIANCVSCGRTPFMKPSTISIPVTVSLVLPTFTCLCVNIYIYERDKYIQVTLRNRIMNYSKNTH